jgi:hypothetical protein
MVTRSPGALCRVRRTPGGVTIEFAGNFVSGPSRLEPALRFVAAAERFRVGDLPGELTAEDRTDLVSRMMSEGLLQAAD